jgi:hypothetical protein
MVFPPQSIGHFVASEISQDHAYTHAWWQCKGGARGYMPHVHAMNAVGLDILMALGWPICMHGSQGASTKCILIIRSAQCIIGLVNRSAVATTVHACAVGSFFNPRSINLESIQSSTNPSSRRTESNNFSCGLWDSPIHGLGLLLRTRGARTRPRGDRLRRQEVTHDGPAVIVCADRRAAQ